jgi:hypothetical protein
MGTSSKVAACECEDSLPSNAEVKDANSTPQYVFKAMSLINNRLNFIPDFI